MAGSDVAKENADVILRNDNFGSIVWAIKWGRNVFNTVTKFLQFQFIITWSSFIVIVLGACILGVGFRSLDFISLFSSVHCKFHEIKNVTANK